MDIGGSPALDLSEIRPIFPNPGGRIAPEDHVGHTAEHALALHSAADTGARITGDRRMGKTSLLRLLVAELSEHVVISFSAESSNPSLVAGRLLQELQSQGLIGAELSRWHLEVDINVKGVHLMRTGTDGAPEVVDDLFAHAAKQAFPRRLIVIIDEVTEFARLVGAQRGIEAEEFLRSLRRARQEQPNLTIFLAGSVGLHHIIDNFNVVNDLTPVPVGALTPNEAQLLARCLLMGQGVMSDNPEAMAAALAGAAENMAFYLHHLVRDLGRLERDAHPSDAAAARHEAIVHPDDPWDLRHYLNRIDPYYDDQGPLVRAVLDALAIADQPMGIASIQGVLSTTTKAPPDRDELVRLLDLLARDHYLRRTGDRDTFLSGIVREAWLHHRRL